MKTRPDNTLMANEVRTAAARPSHPSPMGNTQPKPDALARIQQQQMNKAYEFAEIAARGVRSFGKDRPSKIVEPA
ncbi:MAG: hypothetical protein ACTHJO_04445 [Rhodanobacter sp.]